MRLLCAVCGGPLGQEPPDALPPRRKDPRKGRRIAGADLKESLAVRPTRSVYLAHHGQLRRDVRMEIFDGEFADANYDYVRRLFAGAARTQDLHSPHVTTVLDLGRLADCCYIMTEHLPDSLDRLLDKKGRLPLKRALTIAEEVLQGLVAIEEAGYAHGNVAPDGVLIGYDGAARLDHLGTALRAEDLHRLTLTPGGMPAGPALYRAPEMADAEAEPNIAADLYSLGCTLYRMLSGRPPYLGPTAEDVLDQHAEAPVPDLRAECPDLPQEVARYVARLMAKDPADRPRSAAEALSELHAVVGACTPQRARARFDVRWTGLWTVVALLLIAATIVPFAVLTRIRRARLEAEQAVAVPDPGAVALLVGNHADTAAVRALLLYRLSFYRGFNAADPAYTSCANLPLTRCWWPPLSRASLGRSGACPSAASAMSPGRRPQAPLWKSRTGT